jgi:hypothetical protein
VHIRKFNFIWGGVINLEEVVGITPFLQIIGASLVRRFYEWLKGCLPTMGFIFSDSQLNSYHYFKQGI